jgi:hypothetical protein
MPQVTIELDFKQIENIIEELTPEQQKEIAKKIWAIRIDRISEKMRQSTKKNKLTPKDIKKMCEDARKKVYEKYYY